MLVFDGTPTSTRSCRAANSRRNHAGRPISSSPLIQPCSSSRATAIEHLQRQLVPRAVADLLGDPALLPALAILGPLGGQIEPEIDQGVLDIGDVAEVDADLAVLDFAEAAAPLSLDADGGVPLLGKCRGVEDEHGVGAADDGGDLAVQFVHRRRWSHGAEPRKC